MSTLIFSYGREGNNMALLRVLIAIRKCLEKVAGNSIAEQVIQGSEQITEKTDKKKTALWVKNAIERLDALADERTRMQVMQNCGYNCAKKNQSFRKDSSKTKKICQRRQFSRC
jgi:uncharacterized protein (DUF849 family)